jgi:predicted regulator of Ras-like GTPase activity (Roadblock/LC7/MglB family)
VAKPPAAASPTHSGDLVLSFVELASCWPEGIRSALSVLSGDTQLVLPTSAVSPGLQKGRVAFPWSQVRVWFRPALSIATSIPDDFELTFPLKIVAPAFVAATGARKRHEGEAVNVSLPDFFGPTAGQPAKNEAASPKAPEPAAPPAPFPAAVVAAPAVPSPSPAPEPVAETPLPPAPALKLSPAPEAAVPVPAAAEETAPASVAPPEAGTLAELFKKDGKSTWTPAELVAHTCELPGVAGALVALEEGLVVAQKLPDGFASETFAAFMPQIFGRLERYTEEMQLGATTEIMIQTSRGPCHFARQGKVYFGTLGHVGEPLPAGLKLISQELARQQS